MSGKGNDEECAEVLIDGVPESPTGDASHGAPSLREVSCPVTPYDTDGNVNGNDKVDEGAPVREPSVPDEAYAPAEEAVSAQDQPPFVARTVPATSQNTTGAHMAQRPKRRTSRLYTPPPTAGTPNYGRVLNFSEEQEMERLTAQKRRSVTRAGSDTPTRRSASERAQARRQSRAEERVPRGPAPNYGTVLRFDGDVEREAPRHTKAQSKPSSLGATVDSAASAKTSAEERARRLEQLSRPRQRTACETTPPPNLTKSRKAPARTASLSRLNTLATPRKREPRPEEEVISTPRHTHRPGSAAPVNEEALRRLSQPRQPRTSVSCDPYLSLAREQARASAYGGTTPISLPSKAPAARGTSADRKQSKDRTNSVSWDDIKPAARPTHSLVRRPSTPASPRGQHKAGVAPAVATPPLAKPAAPNALKTPQTVTVPAEQVVASRRAPSVATAARGAASQDTRASAEDEAPKPPAAVRTKRRAAPEAASWQPLGTAPSAPAPAPVASPAPRSTGVVFATRKTPHTTAPVATRTDPVPPAQAPAVNAPAGVAVAASSPANGSVEPRGVVKTVPARVAIKKRPSAAAVTTVHTDPSKQDTL